MMNETIASRKTLLTLIAINALVCVYLVSIMPRGIDFRAFYFAGEKIRSGPKNIYDVERQRREQRAEFNDEAFAPFFHPPHELLLFAPLSKIPYTWSLNVWRVFSVMCLVLSGIVLAKANGAGKLDSLMLVAAMHAVPMCLAVGQDSLLLLLLLSGCFYLLKVNRDIPAALLLALALFKPQLPVVLALAVLAVGRKKFFGWFATFGIALTAGSMIYVGWTGVRQIIATQRIGETGGFGIATMVNLRGLIGLFAGDHRWICLTVLAATVAVMAPVWWRSRSLEFAVASSVCIALALSVYIYDYDLAVLAIPLAIVANSLRRSDTPILASITSAPFLVMIQAAHLNALLFLPTIALGYLTLRRVRKDEAFVRRDQLLRVATAQRSNAD
jgi:hypothetical protein